MEENKSAIFNSFLRKHREYMRSCQERALSRREILTRFSVIFRKYGIKKAYVFGSIQNNSCGPDSDIDLYIEDLEKVKYWRMCHDLEELAGHPVDLYCQFDDPVFIEKIKKRGELFYESGS